MPTFRYTAVTKDGRMVSSTIDAVNLNLAVDTLTASKLKIQEIKPVRFHPMAWLQALQRVNREAVVMVTRRLATMIKTGLPVARALSILYEQEEDKVLKPVLMTVLHDIRVGATLSWALNKHPKVFSQLYISMVKVGETTGDLASMLDRLADFLERDFKVRKQAQSAMTYPAFIFVFAIGVVAFIFLYVLPSLLDVFSGLGGTYQLPLPTRIIMFTISIIRNPWIMGALGVAAVYYAIFFRDFLRTAEGKYKFDRFMVKAPIFGPINKKLVIAQFTRALGILSGTGIPIMRSMEILTEFMDNEYFRKQVCEPLTEGILEGKLLSQALIETDFIPSMTTHMIVVGENTGDLSKMLEKISTFYDMEIVYALDGLLALIEPIMICCMGLITCLVLLGVFMPLYQLIMKIGD